MQKGGNSLVGTDHGTWYNKYSIFAYYAGLLLENKDMCILTHFRGGDYEDKM